MNKKFIQIISTILAAIMLMTSFGVTVSAEEAVTLEGNTGEDIVLTQEDVEQAPEYLSYQNGSGYPKMSVGKAPDGMEKVAENDKYILYVNKSNCFFCVEEKATGYRLYSNPPEDIKINQSGQTTNNLKSQLVVGTAVPSAKSTKNRPSFTFAVKPGTFTVEEIENGVKFVYTSSEEIGIMHFFYAPLDEKGKRITAEEVEIPMEEVANYDYACIRSEEIKETVVDFSVPLYVTIDNNGLVARVPTAEIEESGTLEKMIEATNAANINKDVKYAQNVQKVKDKQDEMNEKAWAKGETPMQLPTPTPPIYSEPPTKEDLNLVYNIQLLPFMGTVIGDGDGYMVVPDGSGSVIGFTNESKISTTYHARLAGGDATKSQDEVINVHESLLLPVVGIKGYDYGFIAIAEEGIGNAWADAAYCGQTADCNRTYFQFDLRYTDVFMIGDTGNGWGTQDVAVYQSGDIDLDALSVRYMFVGAEENDYVGMARTYREYLIALDGFREEVPEEAPFFLSLQGAVRVKRSVLGIPVIITETYTTNKQALDIIDELNTNNIGSLYLILNGWSDSEIRGKVQTGFDPISKIGGKKGLKAISEAIAKYNDKVFLNIDNVYYRKGGNGFSLEWDSARNINAVSADIFYYRRNVFLKDASRGIEKLVSPTKIAETLNKTTTAIMKFDQSMGISLSKATTTLYNDFGNAKNPGNARDDMRTYIDTALRDLSSKISILGSGTLGSYLGQVTATINTPMTNTGFMIALESIPFYQIVLHGYVPYATKPLNQYGNHTEMFLKAIETGSYLYYALMGGNPSIIKDTEHDELYSPDYSYWLPILLEEQKQIAELHALVGTATISAHENLEDGAVTTYDNGVKVVVNYSKKDTLTYSGKSVEPMSYVIIEGGK